MKTTNWLLSASASIICATGSPAFAQTASEAGDQASAFDEILVTAERRESTAQKTAAAITVRAGEQMLAEGRYQLKDILTDIPGMSGGAAQDARTSFTSGTDNPAAGLVIRGIASNYGVAASTTSVAASAALYVDDVYNGIGSTYDLERVEVLRGPQGTLYGRSANSGVVAIHTRDPELDRVEADLTGEVGNYGLWHGSGGVNIPLAEDRLAVRVSGNYYQRDGFYSTTGGGYNRSTDGRIKLLYRPGDTFSALLGFAFNDTRTTDSGVTINQANAAGVPTANQFQFIPQTAYPGKNSALQAWGEFNLDVGGVKLTYIPAFRTFKQEAHLFQGAPINQDQTIRTPHNHFNTQELRVASNGESALQWVLGALYYKNTIKNDFNEGVNQAALFPVPTPAYLAFRSQLDKDTTAFGLFGQATLDLAPGTRLTGGVRYDHTRVRVDQTYTNQDPNGAMAFHTATISGSAGRRTFNNFTYKARLEHDLTPDNLLYASISSGFTPGDISLSATPVTSGVPPLTTTTYTIVPVELTNETLTSYEVGAKNRFLHGRLQINAAAYHYDFNGFQIANVNTAPFPLTAFTRISVPLNVWGAELEVQARPWANGQLSLNMEYSVGRYHDFHGTDRQFFGYTKVPGVAPFRVNASYNHTVPISQGTKLLLTGYVHYNSAYNVSELKESLLAPGGGYPTLLAAFPNGLGPLVRNSAKTTVDLNATLSFSDGRFSISGYVHNLTNRMFKVDPSSTLDLPFPIFQYPSNVPHLNDPRTYGMVLTARF